MVMGGGRGAATKVLWNIVVLEKRCPELRQLGDKFLSTLLTSVSFNPQIRNIESIGLTGGNFNGLSRRANRRLRSASLLQSD